MAGLHDLWEKSDVQAQQTLRNPTQETEYGECEKEAFSQTAADWAEARDILCGEALAVQADSLTPRALHMPRAEKAKNPG